MAQLICMDDQLQQEEKFLSWSKSVIQSAINICGNSRKQNINFVDENSNLFAGMYENKDFLGFRNCGSTETSDF